MDYIMSICGDGYKKKSREECVRCACEFIDETCVDEWETEVKEITQYTGDLHIIIVICVSMLQESMDTYDIRGKTPYEHLTDLCKGASNESMKILSAPRTKKTMEDVVGGMYDMDEDFLKQFIDGVLETETVRDMVDYILSNIMIMTVENDVHVDIGDGSATDDEEEENKQKRVLVDTITQCIKRLHLTHVEFVVRMNTVTTRKDDPHDIVFTYKVGARVEEKHTGKKSWRSCLKSLAKKEYLDDFQCKHTESSVSDIKKVVETSGFLMHGDVEVWVYVVCYIIADSLRRYRDKHGDMGNDILFNIARQDMATLPLKTIDDVIKIFMKKSDEQFEKVVKEIFTNYSNTQMYPKKNSKTFLHIVYEALWGIVRPRHHSDSEHGPSTSKQKQKKTDADMHPTRGSQKQTKKSPAKSAPTPRKRGRPRKMDTAEKEKTRKKQAQTSKDDAAAQTLSQLSVDRIGQTIPSEAIIYNGFGCKITLDSFATLATQLCEMHNISLDDMISYLVSEGLRPSVNNRYCFIGVYESLCMCLASTNPVMKKGTTATVSENGVTTDISVTPMDVISFFAHMLIRERIINRLTDLKDEVEKKRLGDFFCIFFSCNTETVHDKACYLLTNCTK